MCRCAFSGRRCCRWFTVLLLLGVAPAASGIDLDEINALLSAGEYRTAIGLLVAEVEENPAHEAARILLAQAYENAGMSEEAITAWKKLMTLSRNEENLRRGRRAVSRLRRIQLDKTDAAASYGGDRPEDPFKIEMPEIDWEGLEVVEDSGYLPAVLPPPNAYEVPPFLHETEHFTVYSTNERLSRVVGERAEFYLDFMTEVLFGGRSWAVRFPIFMYATIGDYYEHGGLPGSAGLTRGHLSGETQMILLFQLKPDFSAPGARRGGGRAAGGQEVWKYGIESVLPHELTHAVLNEFFAGRSPPSWLHEAIAGRFEQTRDHYGDAARLARKVAAGEYFRMRDLFEQKGYPQRVGLFYEQSAAVVLYLFETGPDAMYAFLSELAAGNGHDVACSAALGIPEEHAVEEFERRWVEWMRRRYIKDLDLASDDTVTVEADRSGNPIFLPWVNEEATAKGIESWRHVDLGSMKAFAGVGGSLREWSVEEGMLRCNLSGKAGVSLLGIRMNETVPVALRCNVRYLGRPGDPGRWLGFAQLDADGDDTRVQALVPLSDAATHEVICIWSDDLAVYLDGKCCGRYPARRVSGDARDVDFPLALVALGPVGIKNLRIAPIEVFSDEPVAGRSDGEDDRGRNTSNRRGRRDRQP